MKPSIADKLNFYKPQGNDLFRRRARRLIFIGAVVLLCCVVPPIARRAYSSRERAAASSLSPPATRPSSPTRTMQSQPTRVDIEKVVISADGFEPTQITRPKGGFFLLVENHSGPTTYVLTLDDAGNNHVSQGQMVVQQNEQGLTIQSDWAELLDLSVGTYVLREASNPSWSCNITITGS